MSDANNINISVTFRHTESTSALKSYAIDKLSHALSKYIKGNADVHAILSIEKRDHTAEVTVKSRDYSTTSTATTDDLYSAIDKVVDVLATQLRKQKEKVLDQKQKPQALEV